MKAVATSTIVVTWAAIAVLVGTMLAFLAMTSVGSDQLYDSIIDGDELGALIIVFVRWSFLTFVCGAPLTWVVVALTTRFRRAQAETRPAVERRSLGVTSRRGDQDEHHRG